MDIIRVYQEAEWVRCFISIYNLQYKSQIISMDADLLRTHMQELCRSAMTDELYWTQQDIDFSAAYRKAEDISYAASVRDYVYIYDTLNYEIWRFIRKVLEVIFSINMDAISSYFWMENRKALQIRYPELLDKLEFIKEDRQTAWARDYGLRGRVAYRCNSEKEFDLYSAYNPLEAGIKITEAFDFVKCSKIYLWGCNGSFTLDGIVRSTENKLSKELNIEVYISNLYEFGLILHNTIRSGLLMQTNIDWKICDGVEAFMNNIELQKKDEAYIYIDECNEREQMLLTEFIRENSFKSNLL